MKFDHYTIRFPVQEDSEKFFLMIESNRKRLEDFFAGTLSKTKTLADTEVFMAEKLTRITEKTYFPFVIMDTQTDNMVGFIDVKNIDWKIPKAELGCFLDKNYTGKNISKRALKMVIDHMFNDMQFNKLFLRTHQDNVEARKLAETCGFIVEGILRHDYKTTEGRIVDLVYYGLLRLNN